jgi:tRNA A-37 threonylcarbamoyl transferase component Bud32
VVSLDEFLVGLRSVAVLPQAEFLRLRSDVPADADEAYVARLANQLVDEGRLTPYQRDLLVDGQWRELCLGEYLVLEPIGKGGMGQVFLALHRHMHRRVALKRLRADVAERDEVVQRFQREIKTIARLSHPNIVTAHDAGEDHGMLYLVMEYVEGETLHELVKRDGQRSVAEAIEYVAQAASGLRAIHAAGIIHRDIKPSNLLRDRQGTLKILDLGLARITGPARGIPSDRGIDSLTQYDQVLGTVDYMAPEQAEGGREVDLRVDIYSLGCCLFYLLTGRPVYQRSSWLDCVLAHREAAIPSLCRARSDVPAALEGIFQRMVAKRPEDRFGSADELLAALAPRQEPDRGEEWAGDDADSQMAVAPYVPMIAAPRVSAVPGPGRRLWFVTGALIVGLLVVAIAWSLWPGDGERLSSEQGTQDTQATDAAPLTKAISLKKPLISLVGHTNTIECLAYLPNGTQLVSSDDDQRVLVWDLVEGQLRYQLAKGDDTGPALALDKSGTLLATAADNDVLKLWDLSTRTEVARLKGHHLVFSPAGGLLAAALNEDPIALYDTTTHENVGELVGHSAWVFALAFSDDGTTLVSGDEDGVLRVWDVERRAQRRALENDVQVNSIALAPGGNLAAAASADGVIRLWNIKTYQLEATLPTHEGVGWGTAFSHDGRLLASAGADGYVVLWDVFSRKQLRRWRAHEGEAVSVAFSPDDKHLASGGDDLVVNIWDLASQGPPH